MKLTNSEMSCWRRCKRKWWLTHHRGLRKVRDVNFNRSLGIGSRVHDCLAAYYDPNSRRDPLEHLTETIQHDLAAYPDLEDDVRKEGDVCRLMLEGYIEWLASEGADQGLRVIEAERAVCVEMTPGVELLTKLDARVEHEELGGRFGLEHKTVSTIKPPAHLGFATQFLTEHLAEFLWLKERGREDERAEGVLWNALLKSKRTARAKGPFYHREPVRHSVAQLRNHWHHVVAIAREIADAQRRLDAGESHHTVCHPNPEHSCSWDCPFIRSCQLLDCDNTRAENMLATQYESGNPLERYEGLLDASL